MKDNRQAGFTLIEVMAALVIVALGMLAVIEAVSQTASNNTYLKEKAVAHWVAMNRITELRLNAQPPPTGENAGEMEMAGKRWRWTTHIVPTDVASMRRIDVSVFPTDEESGDDKDRQLAFVTGFYGEKIAQPGIVTAQFDAAPSPAPAIPGQPSTPAPSTAPAPQKPPPSAE